VHDASPPIGLILHMQNGKINVKEQEVQLKEANNNFITHWFSLKESCISSQLMLVSITEKDISSKHHICGRTKNCLGLKIKTLVLNENVIRISEFLLIIAIIISILDSENLGWGNKSQN